MGYLTSGNAIVDAMGSINITGNIIPAIWYRTITKENGKPYLLAIVILADIVYWYRPSEVRDQGTGHILGWKKKFSEDILRQSYQYYADLFGESKKTVKTAMDRLEKLQVIRREFRTVSYGEGLVCNNVMYVELKTDMLYRLTFPEEMPAMNGGDDSCAGASDDKTGGSLSTEPGKPDNGMIANIKNVIPHIQDSDMAELAGQVLGKLEAMSDEEFAEASLEAAE